MSEIKPWKTLQTDVVYENARFKVRKDICQLPDGVILQDYFVRDEPNIALVFCTTKTGDVVLVRQYRQAVEAITLELPGGLQERHDISNAEAARRELLEETGYSSETLEELATWKVSPATSVATATLYFAPGAEKIASPKYVIGETTEVVLLSPIELKAAMQRSEIIGVLHVAAMFCGLERLQKT